MINFLIPMFFGWPAMIVSLGLALAGILFKRPKLSLAGFILYLPPVWYLGLYFSFLFLITVVLLCLSSCCVEKQNYPGSCVDCSGIYC